MNTPREELLGYINAVQISLLTGLLDRFDGFLKSSYYQ